jgi:hypothetical protein
MGLQVGTPAARAFDIIGMWIVETHTKAAFSRLLPNVMFYMIVDRDLPLRDGPNIPLGEGAYLVICALYRVATRLPSEILDGYTRPFPSQVGQGRNAGVFK